MYTYIEKNNKCIIGTFDKENQWTKLAECESPANAVKITAALNQPKQHEKRIFSFEDLQVMLGIQYGIGSKKNDFKILGNKIIWLSAAQLFKVESKDLATEQLPFISEEHLLEIDTLYNCIIHGKEEFQQCWEPIPNSEMPIHKVINHQKKENKPMIIPQHDMVLVIDHKPKEEKSEGGIIIPESVQVSNDVRLVEIKEVGKQVEHFHKGDKVIISIHGGRPFTWAGIRYRALREQEIIATITEDKN